MAMNGRTKRLEFAVNKLRMRNTYNEWQLTLMEACLAY